MDTPIKPSHHKAMFIICFTSFVTPFMGSSYNLALPDIAEHFRLNAVLLTWFSTGFLISTAIFQVPFARVADIVGRKKIFKLGLIGLALSTLITPFAPNSAALMALRACSGFFSALMFGTNIAILMVEVPLAGRAKALALNTVFVYLALAAGPFIGGILTHYAGWQSICYVSGGLCLIVWLSALVVFKDGAPEAKGERFDLLGSIIYAIGIVGIIYGFTALPHALGFVCIAIGIAAVIVFGIYENGLSSPLLDIKIFRSNSIFISSCLAALVNYAANSATTFMLSLYLQYIRGLSADKAGLILIAQAGIQVFSAMSAGKLSARHAPSKLALIGMSISAIGLASFSLISANTPLWLIIAQLMVLGCGFGLFSSPNTNVIMSSVERRHYGQASATTGTMRLTGQSFSMGIAAMAISIYMGQAKIVPELLGKFMQSISTTFTIFTAITALGIYAAYNAHKKIRAKGVASNE
jgi:MFS family permease